MRDTHKQNVLYKHIKSFLSNHGISYKEDNESGDYLFYLESEKGKLFTFEICGQYTEFYSDKHFDTVYYFENDYVNLTCEKILTYIKE